MFRIAKFVLSIWLLQVFFMMALYRLLYIICWFFLADQWRSIKNLTIGDNFRLTTGPRWRSQTILPIRHQSIPPDANRCHCNCSLYCYGCYVLSETAGAQQETVLLGVVVVFFLFFLWLYKMVNCKCWEVNRIFKKMSMQFGLCGLFTTSRKCTYNILNKYTNVMIMTIFVTD